MQKFTLEEFEEWSWVIWEPQFPPFECRIGFFLRFEFLNFRLLIDTAYSIHLKCNILDMHFQPLELVLFHDSMLIVSWLLTFLLRLRLFFNASASTSSAIRPVRRLKFWLFLEHYVKVTSLSIVFVRICPGSALHVTILKAFVYWRRQVDVL